MITKFLNALLIIFVAAFSINAQAELTKSEQESFKQRVISKANSTKSILSDFTQEKHLSILENKIVSKGKLAFKAPDIVKWEYTEPYSNIAIFKGDKLYVSNEGKKESLDLKSNKLFKSLNALITGSIKGNMFDDEQFDITYYKSEEQFFVKFVPKLKRLRKFISRFELKFSKEKAEVEEVKLIEPNDDFTLIKFVNKQVNITVPNEIFKN